MAFGFGFNKQKALSAAEKFVQQGKLQNAIAEYDKVLKNDPKDLTVNNTIGDLYSRLGDSAKAIECFKVVGDAYAAQGFTVKGIAMYKKITKLQPSVDASLKLAELYTQQGLFNDARAQYLQVAEDFMKNGELDQAVRLFQKVLEMDPENVPMRIKLAEVYVKLGKSKDAWEIFSAAAEALRARGAQAAAEDVLKRMLVLDPNNSAVLLLRGKAALESDDPKNAIAYLEKAADIDSHPDGLRDLLKAYLQIGPLTKAVPVAEKLLTVHNDAEGIFLLAEGCARLGQYREAIEVYTRHADRLLASDSTKLLGSLHTMISHVRDDSDSLDALLSLLSKAGESTHINEVMELLAHSSVKDGNLVRARDLYKTLATNEPQNQLHMQNYQQVVGRIEGVSPVAPITAGEGALIVEELDATAPVIDQSYPDAVAIALRTAVTDADLFLSYNLPDKALVPLVGALPQAPRDIRLNQRLAALHTRFHQFSEAAVCCRTLENVYHEAGQPDEALRYGELAARYEHSVEVATAPVQAEAVAAAASSGAHSSSATVAPPWPMATPAPTGHMASSSEIAEFAVHESPAIAPLEGEHPGEISGEISHAHPSDPALDSFGHVSPEVSADGDLASEWESSLSVDDATTAPFALGVAADLSSHPEIAETVEEIRFYLEHFMTDQARAGLERLETLTSSASILVPLRAAMAAAGKPPAEPETVIAEINADDPSELGLATDATADESSAHESDFVVSPGLTSGSSELMSGSSELMSGYENEIPAVAHTQDAGADISHLVPDEAFAAPLHLESAHMESFPAGLAPARQGESMSAPSRSHGLEHAETIHAEPVPAEADNLSSLVADLEASLGNAFPQAPAVSAQPPATHSPKTQPLSIWPAPDKPVSHSAGTPSRPAAPPTTLPSESLPVKSFDVPPGTTSMPISMPSVAASAAGTATAPAPASSMSYTSSAVRPLGAGAEAMHAPGSVDLSEMFGALRQELEEDVISADDDPETHYNLGVAFREMGLLDEAITELQKVCTSIERGKAFTQPIQTYTWLAQCFLDKGVPEAAIRWYEKALAIPGLDEEARLAINYELGSACETARDKSAALRHFTAVYGSNIDYRDVAERIQSLKS